MNIKPVSDPDTFRSEIRKYIKKYVKDEKISINIEKSIFNFSVRKAGKIKVIKKWENEHFVLIYINKFKVIFHNLKNKLIIDKLKKNIIKPHEMSFLSHIELLPEKWEKQIEEKKLRLENKFFPKIEASTDNFTLSIDLSSDLTISIFVRATLKSFLYKVSFKSAIIILI